MSLHQITIGHHALKESLIHYLQGNPQTNTLLFAGPPGSGKSYFLKAFAKDFLCMENTGVACGQCSSCKSFLTGMIPDFIECNLQKNPIKIQQIRDLQQDALLHPVYSNKKLIVLYGADGLTIEASNALLKMLEEPSASTCFILETSMPDKILSTIRSRSVLFRFLPYSDGEMKSILEESGLEEDSQKRELLSFLANGNAHRAFKLCHEEYFSKRVEYCSKFGTIVLEEDAIPTFPKKMEKKELYDFIFESQSILEDAIRFNLHREDQVKNKDQIQLIQTIGESFSLPTILELQEILLQCEQMTDSSGILVNKLLLKIIMDCKKSLFS
jgi:DNA polymerase III subunit delta'